MKMGDIASAEEEDEPDDIPEGFHLQEESPHCINMTRAEDYPSLLEAGGTRIRKIDKKVERLTSRKNMPKLYRACSGQ